MIKPRLITIVGLVTFLILCGSIFSVTSTVITVYNTLVKSKTRAEQRLADLESEYQLRYAVIDNLIVLVKETKGFEQLLMDFEKSVYIETAKAKASATQLSVTTPAISATRFKQEERLTQALSQFVEKFLMLAQHYPSISDPQVKDRTATFDALRDLKTSLTQIEDQILQCRRDFNDAVRVYNQNLAIFPANLFSTRWGFTRLQGFEVINEAAKQDAHIQF